MGLLDEPIAAAVDAIFSVLKPDAGVQLLVPLPGDYDPVSGSSSGDELTPTYYTLVTVPPQPVTESDIALDNNIKSTDLKTMVQAAGLAIVPTTDHKLKLAQGTFNIVSVMPQYSGDDVAVYTLFARK